MIESARLRTGEWVEVRSKQEILKTLDDHGQLEGLPFMPEMFEHCGRRFQVFKRAHKTCDPPSGVQARRMRRAVHLSGVRCGGEAHGGCQAGCLIFWKEAWLKEIDARTPSNDASMPTEGHAPFGSDTSVGCTEHDVCCAVHAAHSPESGEPAYVCQSTRLYAATEPLPWWDLRQYLEDLTSGNVRAGQMAAALLFSLYTTLAESGLGFGSALRWAYDTFQKIRRGVPYPRRIGKIPRGRRTPSAKLDLRPGELVRVRTYAEILETLDEDWRNRGMLFDSEAVPFCGGTHTVLRRVDKIIDEKTGKMVRLRNDAVILNEVVCQARYAICRHFCSRSIYPYWREIWLERLSDGQSDDQQSARSEA